MPEDANRALMTIPSWLHEQEEEQHIACLSLDNEAGGQDQGNSIRWWNYKRVWRLGISLGYRKKYKGLSPSEALNTDK